MVGMERSLLPLVAEREFAVASASAATSFLVAFGLVKAWANLAAGGLSDRFGRRRVLVGGWLVGLPVPFVLAYAPAWGWIVGANVLLGIHQGLTWSATVVMKVDLAGPKRRGLATGLNESSGYVAVAVVAFGTAALASRLGELRPGPMLLGAIIVFLGLVLSLFVKETHGHALGEAAAIGLMDTAQLWEALARTTWKHRGLAGCSQAGLVNNANDALMWGVFPLLASAAGLSLGGLGLVAALYPGVWGVAQLGTGPLSDSVGRRPMIAMGMGVQAVALAGFALTTGIFPWAVCSVALGMGTAMVYPTLLAAVGDLSGPQWRASAIGGYRFWRDNGYAVGGLSAGLLADAFGVRWAIGVVAIATGLSGLVARILLPRSGSSTGQRPVRPVQAW
jgi:MFS family permease